MWPVITIIDEGAEKLLEGEWSNFNEAIELIMMYKKMTGYLNKGLFAMIKFVKLWQYSAQWSFEDRHIHSHIVFSEFQLEAVAIQVSISSFKYNTKRSYNRIFN